MHELARLGADVLHQKPRKSRKDPNFRSKSDISAFYGHAHFGVWAQFNKIRSLKSEICSLRGLEVSRSHFEVSTFD